MARRGLRGNGRPTAAGALVLAVFTLALSGLVLFGLAPAARPAVSWSSGATAEEPEAFGNWRGRPLDITGTSPNRETWQVIQDPDISGAVSALSEYERIWIGLAMLPEEQDTSFAECAGRHDRLDDEQAERTGHVRDRGLSRR